MSDKLYLSDGVYAEWDGLHIVLTAENGISITDTIYLDEDTWRALVEYIDRLRSKAKGE